MGGFVVLAAASETDARFESGLAPRRRASWHRRTDRVHDLMFHLLLLRDNEKVFNQLTNGR